jgi:hypothetical protein
MKSFWLLVAGFLLAVPARSGDFSSSAQGTTTAEFLQLGVGARAVAMGEAYSAVTDEASAMYWNPAALTNIQNRSATFMHAAYIGSSYFDYAAYGQNLGSKGAFGASLQYFSAGGITQTDTTGTDVGSFNPYELAFSLGYAHKLDGLGVQALNGYSVGLAGKFIQSRILTTAQTEAFDFGVLSPTYFSDRLKLAFTMTNLGGTMKFDAANESLPLNFKLGSSYKITDHWLTAMDVNSPRNDNPYIALGTEYQLATSGPWKMAGRAGFNSETIGSITGFTGVSVGIGIGYSGLAMDYAFVPLGGVGQAHRLSLTCNF